MRVNDKRGRGTSSMTAVALGMLLLTAACSGDDRDSDAVTLTMASYQPPGSPWRTAYEQWATEVEEATDGEVTIEILDNESLLAQADIMPGVGSGQADIGFFVNSFHPAELPLSSASENPFVTHDALAQAQAFDELYETYGPLRDEYNSQGIEVAAFQPATPAVMSTREPVDGPEQLDGMQVRAFGYLSEALTSLGSEPAAIPLGEVYESLERGVIDANTTVFENTHELGLDEVAPHVTDIGTGSFAIAVIGFNREVWSDLSEEHQETIRALTQEAANTTVEEFGKAGEEACQAAIDGGGEVRVWDDATISDWRSEVYDGIVASWLETTGDSEAGQEFLDKYLAAVEEKSAESGYEPSVVTCANGG